MHAMQYWPRLLMAAVPLLLALLHAVDLLPLGFVRHLLGRRAGRS